MSNELWSFVTLVSLFGWVFFMLVLLFKAFPGRGQFEAKSARIWGIAVLISYSIWIVGMLNA